MSISTLPSCYTYKVSFIWSCIVKVPRFGFTARLRLSPVGLYGDCSYKVRVALVEEVEVFLIASSNFKRTWSPVIVSYIVVGRGHSRVSIPRGYRNSVHNPWRSELTPETRVGAGQVQALPVRNKGRNFWKLRSTETIKSSRNRPYRITAAGCSSRIESVCDPFRTVECGRSDRRSGCRCRCCR